MIGNGNLLTSLFDYTTGLPFPNLKIPANRLYAPGLAVLNRYPVPNVTQTPGLSYNYEATAGDRDAARRHLRSPE